MKKTNESGTNQICAEPTKVATSNKRQNLLMSLKQAETQTTGLFEQTLDALDNLAQARTKCKLSNSRVAGVYRELKELAKVMSIYK